jgi:hypothetical protein
MPPHGSNFIAVDKKVSMYIMKINDPRGGTNFDPRAII